VKKSQAEMKARLISSSGQHFNYCPDEGANPARLTVSRASGSPARIKDVTGPVVRGGPVGI
jgi:hypothetical protein